MKNLGENQIKVLAAAKQKINQEAWFRGICVDHVPTEQECIDDFAGAVNSVVCETMYWDALTLWL
jgi:hypothetical protein